LKSFTLIGFSSPLLDLTPLQDVENTTIDSCHGLVTLKGLGKCNKIVRIIKCRELTDLSAIKAVPRVIIIRCDKFVNYEDLNQVHFLTIEHVSDSVDFSGLKREKGGRVNRLELTNCDRKVSFNGLDEIPFLKILSYDLRSLQDLGGKANRIIIVEANYESLADQFLPKDCYSKTFYQDEIKLLNDRLLMFRRTEKES
jgi:hypothetical protein